MNFNLLRPPSGDGWKVYIAISVLLCLLLGTSVDAQQGGLQPSFRTTPGQLVTTRRSGASIDARPTIRPTTLSTLSTKGWKQPSTSYATRPVNTAYTGSVIATTPKASKTYTGPTTLRPTSQVFRSTSPIPSSTTRTQLGAVSSAPGSLQGATYSSLLVAAFTSLLLRYFYCQ